MDEAPGAQRRQQQYKSRAQHDKENVAPRTVLDRLERLGLVEAIADEKSSGIRPHGGQADNPRHTVEVEDLARGAMVEFQVFVGGHFLADEPAVLGGAREDRAV